MDMENEDSKQILVNSFGFDIETELQGIKPAEFKLEILKESSSEIKEEISKFNKSDEEYRIGIYYLGKILNEIMLELTHDSGKSTGYGKWLKENWYSDKDKVDPSHRSEQNYRNLYKYIHEKFDGAGFFLQRQKPSLTILYKLAADKYREYEKELHEKVINDENITVKNIDSLFKKYAEERFNIERLVNSEIKSLDHEGYYKSKNTEETQKRIIRSIAQRRGQPKFREDLLKAYESKCAITGCDAQEALEAAHIIPYSETENNHLSNGLLLRADLHTLFDLNLIAIDPHTDPDERKVRIAPSLGNTEYRKLEGISLRQPNNQDYLPKKEFLDEHCKQCWWYRLPPDLS